MPSREQFHQSLERDAAAFATLVRDGDLSLPVPSCPGWTTLDLAEHLGGVHRWARDAIVNGELGDRSGPPAGVDLGEWFASGATELLEVLRATDPDAPAWTFGPHPRKVSFWDRRQAHETALHLWDAQVAQGRPTALDAELAVDAVAEIVEVMFPRQVRLERIPPLSVGVRIKLTDFPEHRFVIAGDGTDPDAVTAATLEGAAVDVLLALWRRASVAGLTITGDPSAVTSVIEAGITP